MKSCCLVFCAVFGLSPIIAGARAGESIDRAALVARHAPVLRAVEPRAPLSVGNGRFAFTADVTGLQTFPEHYHGNGTPLATLARWAWHTNSNPHGYSLADANRPFTLPDGRVLGFPTNQRSPAGQWLRENPHDFPLAQLSLEFAEPAIASARAPTLTEISDIEQKLDLWRGAVTSRYTLAGTPVEVVTAAHPDLDLVAVRITSSLVGDGRLGVRLAFPRGHDLKTKNNPPLDWSEPESHTTRVAAETAHQFALERSRDDFRYRVGLAWSGRAQATPAGAHAYRLRPYSGDTLEFVLAFARDALPPTLPDFAATLAASARHWAAFWQRGAAIDFSGSTDPRAAELERRVVLSQYLTALQFGGDFPPQETGLTASSWYGKHHTEMIWWHVAHFALWGRPDYTANALRWYVEKLPVARALAAERGLRGARWAKMVGPEGRESPGGPPLIVWNQPHPIHLAELLYRASPTPETLARYRELVFDTADGLASMLHWDEKRGCYVLGPPLWIAQEIYDQATSQNPSFELSYWAFALDLAQSWRERLGLPRDPDWEHRRTHLPPLPQKDGRYVALESHPDTWDNIASRHDHPTMLAPLGMLRGDGVDPATMRRTLDAVLATWDWKTKIWGWDYPMIAMTAARIGDPATAVDILLKDGPNNHYTANGHCPQRADLPVYLPANGALLAAVAMMAGGWDGAPAEDAPGFPRDGTWSVRAEGFLKLP
ncbi:MAG TPA: hypothetical protein VGD81_17155 [Opitutaceae bacterium]